MTYPSKEEVERYTVWDRIALVGVVAVAATLLVTSKRETETKISGIVEHLASINEQRREIDKRLDRLEKRVYFPLFTAHCSTCQQCGNPQITPDGPESLCEEGFKLWQQDMRSHK